MQKINSGKDLKSAIQLMEAEQAMKGELLKEQIFTTYESLKPVNLITRTMKDLSSSPYVINSLAGSALGLATGYFSKRIVVGASTNIIRKLIGTALQFGITTLVAKKAVTIKSTGQSILQRVFRRGPKE
jgi:hypothetical protein